MMILFLQLLTAMAMAADVPPREKTIPVRVYGETSSGAYHPLLAGKQLTFSTPGPGVWSVEIRQRLPTNGLRADGQVLVMGNGKHQIMAINLKGKVESKARIDDTLGGTVTIIERASITVPMAGEFLALRAPKNGKDVLIRLYKKGTKPTPLPKPVAKPPAPVVTAAKVPPPPKPKAPPPKPPAKSKLGLGTGISMGLGIPARGTKAVGYLGADVRYPVYKKLVSVGGSAGWYRIAVKQSTTVADPLLGHTTVDSQWHTDVFPIVARGLAHSPLKVGPVAPVAGAGVGLFIARRSEAGQSTTKVGVGPDLLVGAEIDAKHLGHFGANITWTEARLHLGNTGPDGEPVRETLANTRLNLCWFHTF